MIEYLEQENQLLDLFLQDLAEFKAHGTSAQSVRHTAMEQISVRLAFLEYILCNSTLSLSIAQADSLWDSLVTKASNEEEREAFFRWLDKTRGEPAREGFMVREKERERERERERECVCVCVCVRGVDSFRSVLIAFEYRWHFGSIVIPG